MGLSLSTPRAAWVSPAAAKASSEAAMSAEATPRPRHSASVPSVMIQPSRRPVTSSSAS